MKHVLFAAAESAPFIKTGGLGSVIGSLPKELNQLNTKVSVVIPGYECIVQPYKDQMEDILSFPVRLNWRLTLVKLAKLEVDGVTCYFIKNDYYFVGEQPYGDIWQDIEKYAFFCKAVLVMLTYLQIPVDIIHCHDWQTGLLPVFLKEMFGYDSYLQKVKTIMTIHNLKFQGVTSIERMKDITGLPDHVFSYDKLENYGDANMLKGGIAYADIVTTVSRTYAEEIKTPEFGEYLDPLLAYRKDDLYGIVNGIDWKAYDPSQDPYVSHPYDKTDFVEKRLDNKLVLQKIAGFAEDKKIFTMGIVSRLTEQKGYDLLDGTLDEFLEAGAQLYVLGAGEESVENIFRFYKEKYPKQVFVETDYSDTIAKAIYAGCDLTLMPSRFEPCGLNQLMALRYGCLPLVRATGGLKDTVEDDGNLSGDGTGFVFTDFDKTSFISCLKRAYELYQEYPDQWQERMRRGMEKDFSWKTSAFAYKKLYNMFPGEKITDLLEMMRYRRSVRAYTGEEVSDEALKKVLQAALLAPSSRGRRSWEFIVIRDKETILKLSKCREHGSGFLEGADKAIVVVGDASLSDAWIEDCSIAMAMMYLMADSLDLGACWVHGRNRYTEEKITTDEYVRELLGIPEKYALEAIMALGHPQKKADPYELEELSYHKVHDGHF